MPAVLTYNTLLTTVPAYSERPNDAALLAQMPQIILFAESELAADLRILGNELLATGNLTVNSPLLARPAFWHSTLSLSITVGTSRIALKKRTYEYLRTFWPESAVTDVPRFYAEYTPGSFFIAPTPVATYAYELVYTARINPLDNATQTNWWTVNAPQTLLYACMYHTSLFLKNYDKADYWKAQYAGSLQALAIENVILASDRTNEKK